MVKSLPFMDIPAEDYVLQYDLSVRTNYTTLRIRRIIMRHFYFRLILGIVFIGCMIFSFVTMNISFALLYLALGVVFLLSAYSLWKKDKDNRR